MKKKKSPYKKGDIKWVFLIIDSYPYLDTEHIAQVEFTSFYNGVSHEAKILRGMTICNGYKMIPVFTSGLNFHTKIFDSYVEANEELIRFIKHQYDEKIKKLDRKHQESLSIINDWVKNEANKDLVREMKISSICNER